MGKSIRGEGASAYAKRRHYQMKQNEINKRSQIALQKSEARMRKCLRCPNVFWSEGYHNQHCDNCRRVLTSLDF